MNTYEMLTRSIEAKKSRGALTTTYIASTKAKMDVFLMADRITTEEFDELTVLLAE